MIKFVASFVMCDIKNSEMEISLVTTQSLHLLASACAICLFIMAFTSVYGYHKVLQQQALIILGYH